MPRKPAKDNVKGQKKPVKVVPPSRDTPVTFETVKDPAILKEIEEYAKEGCTLKQIASRLMVHSDTLYKWSKKYPEVEAVLKEGMKVADDRVEQSLYDLCFPHDEREIIIEKDKDGIIVKQTVRTKHIPANATAIQYWLQNRRREDWKSHQSLEFTGNSVVPVQIVYDLPTKKEPTIKGKDDDDIS